MNKTSQKTGRGALVELRELKALVELMRDSGLTELEVDGRQGRIRLVRGEAHPRAAQAAPSSPVAEAASVVARPAPSGPAAIPALELAAGQVLITSPMVGTFYRAAAPDAQPFVREGDSVHRGQTLCIVEAMKMLNEIEATVSGRLVRVLVDNGQPVQYGQPLMVIEGA
jgi:acetyl-CoA carboxylase biotin carboxyl carrier protein